MEIRLQKWLSGAGVASRRKSEALIAEGRVTVNGRVVTELGAKADPQTDAVALDGKPLPYTPTFEYLILHKPEGVITTTSDPQGRPTVMDLLPKDKRLFPVGRLDYDSSGLLIITNDGDLAQALTHPSRMTAKKYAAKVSGVPSSESLRKFKQGLVIDGRRTAPCEIKIDRIIKDGAKTQTLVHIILREGRNRQIRKMCEVIGHPVLFLKRIAVGPLTLGDLPRGHYRRLTPEEVRCLRAAASGNTPDGNTTAGKTPKRK